MKITVILCLLATVVVGCSSDDVFRSHLPVLAAVSDLGPNVGRRVALVGKYHDPGKGERVLDCGFSVFPVADYSLYDRGPGRELIATVEEGEEIEVTAILRFHAATLSLIDEDGWVQTNAPVVTKGGKKYFATGPSYFIEKVEIVKRRNEKQQNSEPAQPTPGS